MNRLSITRKLQIFAMNRPGLGAMHTKARSKFSSLPRGYRKITGR